MKSYKFLRAYYKSILESMEFNVQSIDLSECSFLYNELIATVMKFKDEVKYNCKCIDSFTDLLLLSGKISSNVSIDERVSTVIKFMNTLSITDFRKFRMFRLYMEREYKASMVDTITSKRSLYIYLFLSSSLFIIECGLLYEPLKLTDRTSINLSKYLEALITVDLNYINTSGFNPLDYFDIPTIKKLPKSKADLLTVKIIETFRKDNIGAFTDFLLNLDRFCHSMYIKEVKDLLTDRIPVTDFRFCLLEFCTQVQSTDLNVRKPLGFPFRYIISTECIEWFKDRDFLIPNSGILIDNGEIKTLACECYDEICGYSVYYTSSIKALGISTIDSLHLQYSLSDASECDISLQNLYVLYNLYEKHVKDHGVTFLPGSVGFSLNCIDGTYGLLRVDYESNLGKVLLPSYWSNRGTNHAVVKKDPKSINNFIGTKIELIKPFKKKLPEGFRRSYHATRLAKELCINLEENETVVSQFIRERKIKNV